MPWCRSWMVYWIIWRSIPLRSGLSRQWWVPGAYGWKIPGVPVFLSMGNPACSIGILITHDGSWNNPYINLFFLGGSWMTGVRMIFFTCFFFLLVSEDEFGWFFVGEQCSAFHEPKHERWGTKNVSLWGFHLQNRCNDLYLLDSCGIYSPNKRVIIWWCGDGPEPCKSGKIVIIINH